MKPCLRRHIGMDGGPPEDGRDRARVDDAAELVWQHQPHGVAREAEAGGEVDRDHAVEILVLPVGDGAAVLDAGVVDENVELAVARRDVFERTARATLASVTSKAMASAPIFGGGGIELGLVARVDDDLGAILRQRLGHGEAQAARGAGDEGHAALERKHAAHATSSRR